MADQKESFLKDDFLLLRDTFDPRTALSTLKCGTTRLSAVSYVVSDFVGRSSLGKISLSGNFSETLDQIEIEKMPIYFEMGKSDFLSGEQFVSASRFERR